MSDTDEIKKAAWNLTGKTTDNGWSIIERLPHVSEDPESKKTGGTFSVGYSVEKNGNNAFMKVFDILRAFERERKLEDELDTITKEYNNERNLLDLCTSGRMSRVVKILDHGEIRTPFPLPIDSGYTLPLYFIIFERADGGDIRDVFNTYDKVNDAIKLEYLHHTIVAIQQIHKAQISHQDIKPSNVVVFKENGDGAKLVDFGRALKKGVPAPHESLMVAGARYNAPPEQLYGHDAPDWHNRREAGDLYNFGSLVSFMYSGVYATTGILYNMKKELHPSNWQGAYEDVLPMVQMAFSKFLVDIRPTFPEWARDELECVVKLCCEPDVYRRGDPNARAQVGKPIGVDRFISRINSLRIEAKRRLLAAKTRF